MDLMMNELSGLLLEIDGLLEDDEEGILGELRVFIYLLVLSIWS